MSNYWNGTAAFGDWFDDATWSNTVLPQAANLAGAARLLGFAGVAFDGELYPGKSGTAGTWDWNYPGNTHSESAVRAQVKLRGAQLMNALVGAFPGIDIVTIHPLLPEGWAELVQQVINGVPNAYQNMVGINFWDGMTSVPGYGPIRFMDQTYNKTSHLFQATWDTAFTYDLNRMSAMFSRRLSNWAYASSRIDWGPFAWINAGPQPFDAARSPQEVAAQLAAFRKWGTEWRLRQLRLRRDTNLLRLHALRRGHAGRRHAGRRRHRTTVRHAGDSCPDGYIRVLLGIGDRQPRRASGALA